MHAVPMIISSGVHLWYKELMLSAAVLNKKVLQYIMILAGIVAIVLRLGIGIDGVRDKDRLAWSCGEQ